MRTSTIFASIALLAVAGVAGAQGTQKVTSHASSVAAGAKMAGPADSTAHAVNKSRRRRHRNAKVTSSATKAATKKDSVAAKPSAMASHSKAPAKKP